MQCLGDLPPSRVRVTVEFAETFDERVQIRRQLLLAVPLQQFSVPGIQQMTACWRSQEGDPVEAFVSMVSRPASVQGLGRTSRRDNCGSRDCWDPRVSLDT